MKLLHETITALARTFREANTPLAITTVQDSGTGEKLRLRGPSDPMPRQGVAETITL
jgi:hypothetical protein